MVAGFSKQLSRSRSSQISQCGVPRYNIPAMNVRVILVPYDSGHCRKRMGLGPERILDEGLKKLFPKMQIQFDTVEIGLDNPHPAEISTAFELGRKVAEKVLDCGAEGVFPLVLSGNCNASLGTV